MAYNQNIQNNFLNKYSRVPQNTTEWARIEYLLQLSLGSTSAVVSNIWSIANPSMILTFEKRTKNLLALDSWLETSQLDENTRIERVCQKGFDFQNKGLLFRTGHLQLAEKQLHKNKVYEVLLLKIAVGKSYCLPAKSVVRDNCKLAYGFDSIYFYDEDEDTQSGIFKHDYMLFDNNQVLPMYIVHFEYDQSKEEALIPPLCDLCQENNASLFCQADDAVLCYECDQEHHGGKLAKKHHRVPISEKPKSFGVCPSHQDAKLELYCTYCHTPLCVYCKISGSHSGGEAANHPLVKITDAYKKGLADSKELDPLLEKRKNQLAELLSQIDQRIKEINKNASLLEEKIYKILQNALLQLQEETQKKMSFLIGDQLELKRQYDHIQWLESFLKYQQDVLNPADYLSAWSRHSNFRNEVLQISEIPLLTNVQADMRILENKLTITTEQQGKSYDQDQEIFSPEKQQLLEQQQQLQFHQQQDPYDGGNMMFTQNVFGKHQGQDKNQQMLRNVINNYPQRNQQGLRQDIHIQEQNQPVSMFSQDLPQQNIAEIPENEEEHD